MIWKPPEHEKRWVYQRGDGCELELYAATKEEAIQRLVDFGVTRLDVDKLKEVVRRERKPIDY